MGQDWPIQGAVDEYRCDLDSLGGTPFAGPLSRHRQNGLHRRSFGPWPNTVRPLRRVRG